MARLRYLKQISIRALISPLSKNDTFYKYSTTAASAATNIVLLNPLYSSDSPVQKLQAEDVVVTFREWFMSGRSPFIERILEILSFDGGSRGIGENEDFMSSREAVDVALSQLNLHLTESLVLDVLSYGKDVLSCLKFFDWAGRQPGFHHTRATFNAIFKILSRAKLMSLMLDYLDNYSKHRGGHKTNFHAILVMGYAVAGKLEIALQLFGRMRYQGIDLDDFSYHVLLNALVEEDDFDGVESVARQIKSRGFESEVTYSILIKAFCRKKEFDRAETYLREMMDSGVKIKSRGHMVGALVDGLCKNDQFDKAGKLVDEFGEFYVYDIWIRELLRARKLDGAMEFMQKTRNQELVVHYVPDIFRYNTLIMRLLRENRLEEVCDLVIEMRENNIPPDELTMNIVLCFFCKAGMVDVALKLYDSRGELGLSPSSMAFNYLLNTLCGDGSVVDAYRIFKNLIKQGYFPGKTTFSILADALCKLEKLELMNELFLIALEKNVVLTDSIHENYIMALCRTGRVEDGYFIHRELNKLQKVTTRRAYSNMIIGFIKSKRGDIAARLLIEMQEKGHTPTRLLFRAVVQSVCEMENPEKQFQRLLEMQLSLHELDCGVFNIFMEGAGLAKKPDLAREVYEMMKRSGISPNVRSDILMLKSYLRSEKVSDALHFFYDILKRRKIGRKVCNTMVTGLCKANKPDIALSVFSEIREKEKTVRPSLECYEELIYALCRHKRYDKVMDLIVDLIGVGRPLSSFIGNNLLLHSMKHQELYNTWMDLRSPDEMSPIWRLMELVDLFSNHFRNDIDPNDLEKVVGNCFPLDIYTYNMLIRKLSMKQVDDASLLFQKICQKGHEPNQWTYESLVHGFYRHGRKTDAKVWVEEMLRRGFVPSEATKLLL
ncbi:pentatricopeptide repeat-containing protein At1g71210, mitochondrial-like [Cynara cardunculus var. scolymus]|uniref:Pentatricopeptide repeat-containing protein n=1 Tax=Cynara cardunculus var. scolymus TaxID=59895 RepID=A0A103XYY0_CYNCS|nr:pentatricopeptide repeat-containing protein At1g71210, mitochondrial-like [Cynara cardunculus var. scolymus]KVH99360.1 Pentatricopeptide repeat-containing protein [Cynara cardunculus var. scolymus]